MKRKIISCLIQWVIIGSSFMLVSGNEYTEYTFKVYDMNKNDFLSFIENPKTEKIEQITNYKVYFIDRLKNTFPVTYAPHYHQYIDNELVYTSVLDGLRLNATKIKQQLFDFCNEYDKLEKIFSENNIQCEVLNVLPFSCNKFMSCSVQIPLTLFINTNTGDYFLTLDEFVMKNINEINILDDNEYYLHVYTPTEYYEAFKLYNGEIYVNNIKIEENDIQFQAYECYIPLRSVMEAAGCVVNGSLKLKI